MLKRFLFLFPAAFGFAHFSVAQEEVLSAENLKQKAGYFNTTELNFSFGFQKENVRFPSGNSALYAGIQTINGYRFNQHLSVGLGVGVDQHFYSNRNQNKLTKGELYLPVFSDVTLYLGKGKTQPFFSQDLGYAFCILPHDFYENYNYLKNIGGTISNSSIGITTPLSEKTNLNFSLGYRYQKTTIKYTSGSGLSYNPRRSELPNITLPAHFLTFKTGLTF